MPAEQMPSVSLTVSKRQSVRRRAEILTNLAENYFQFDIFSENGCHIAHRETEWHS